MSKRFLYRISLTSMKQYMRLSLLLTSLVFTGTTVWAKTDFNKEILPLLEKHCLKCHKAAHEENGKMQKPKGDIRLDAAWAILLGNKDVTPVKPKDIAHSAIITVITLPRDDDKAMPPEGKGDPFTPAEILKLKTWITEGADFDGWVGNLAGKPAESQKTAPVSLKEREHEKLYKKLAAGLQPPAADVLKKLQSSGAQIASLMTGSPLLRVDFLKAVNQCDDNTIAALAPIKNNIVQLDLARTRITDEAFKSISLMPRLTHLDLRKTKISDTGIAQLTALKNLVSLNLYGTEITDAAIASLSTIKTLKIITIFESKMTEAGVNQLKTALPQADIVFNVDLTAADKPVTNKKEKKSK